MQCLFHLTWLLCMDTAQASLSGSCRLVTVPPPAVFTTHFSGPMTCSEPDMNFTTGYPKMTYNTTSITDKCIIEQTEKYHHEEVFLFFIHHISHFCPPWQIVLFTLLKIENPLTTVISLLFWRWHRRLWRRFYYCSFLSSTFNSDQRKNLPKNSNFFFLKTVKINSSTVNSL